MKPIQEQDALANDLAALPSLERVPVAAKRMAVSTAQAYRELRNGRHPGPIVKLGPRASAVPVASTNQWIQARLSEARGRQR